MYGVLLAVVHFYTWVSTYVALIHNPNISIKLKFQIVVTFHEKHQFRMVYFEIKYHVLYGAATSELVLSWVAIFIDNDSKIAQVI